MLNLSDIRRLYVRKKEGFRQGEESLTAQLKEILGDRISDSAIYHRYDVDGLTDEDYEKAVATVFSEPPVDDTQRDLPKGDLVMGVEFLPGQYDQRADSAEQCLAIVTGKDGARVRCALVYVFNGHFEKGDREKILKFLVNPVESREASLLPAETLDLPIEEPKPVPVMKGLRDLDDAGIDGLIDSMGLAMSHDDLVMIRDYFRDEEKRDPTETEIRVLDTYWSDHCRHTTFSTKLTDIDVEDGTFSAPISRALKEYEDTRIHIYGKDTTRPVTLMDMATAAVKVLRKEGKLANLDASEEVNACTIKVKIDTANGPEDWLLLFKNETHNHPTEIEPFGGATGSSKELNTESIETCGAEVQKGNPLTERKIQCLFRRGEVTRLIKRCNDFGAGGVSVAVGELTDGLDINLDKVPKKYEGLDGTELAISESQERMAVVVRKEDADQFIKYAAEENLEATVIADVTDTKRLVMKWRGTPIVDISRAFLDTNGAQQVKSAHIAKPDEQGYFHPTAPSSIRDTWLSAMGDLNNCSQQGLSERFDSTVGAGTVLMPFGGKYQKTPADGMVAKFPVRKGETDSASFMAHGFDPDLATWSPFHGAVYAVLFSVTRLVSMGADWRKAYLTLQEYFEKLTDKTSWGKPAAALLGAFHMQEALGLGAIGGKDSMSGTFNDLHVPPTLVSFAIAPGKASEAVSQELKKEGDALVLFGMPKDKEGMPNIDVFKAHADFLYKEVQAGHIAAMKAVGHGGVAVTAAKMAFGNGLGIHFTDNLPLLKFFSNFYGAIIVETTPELAAAFTKQPHTKLLGTVGGDSMEAYGEKVVLTDLLSAYEKTLDPIFPRRATSIEKADPVLPESNPVPQFYVHTNIARPRVFIPTMPGNNCEVDSARAFERAGAVADIFIFRNRDSEELKNSVEEMAERIRHAQIVMFPGGFSAGDEPDGSGKFIAAVFRNEKLKEAMDKLLHERDGLALGICNGFQALIKLGLVPYGEFKPLTSDAPTLTFNTIGRHLSRFVTTKVVSTKSPWLSLCKPGDLYSIAISHGEGRFIASDEQVKALAANGQIATQYTDFDGNPTYDSRFNPNGSCWAVEGITSPDGRVLGKMGHTERRGDNIAKNISGNKYQPLFEAGVKYFQG